MEGLRTVTLGNNLPRVPYCVMAQQASGTLFWAYAGYGWFYLLSFFAFPSLWAELAVRF